VLIAGGVAVCAALGWWSNGGVALAVVAIVLAVAAVLLPVEPSTGSYAGLVRAWALILSASFGIASLLSPSQGFFSRGLSAVGLAIAIGFGMTSMSSGGKTGVERVMSAEYGRRTDATIGWFNQVTSSPEWRRMAASNAQLDTMAVSNEADLRKLPERAARVMPALLALESLIALALSWALYHRLARTAAGPELGKLRDFKFNDQLIWGLAVGATIYFLPLFEDGRTAGLNLLIFFGALYLLRGVGVLTYVVRGRWMGLVLILMTVFAPILLAALALGVGVGDTWMDWRSRAQSAT
jgi:hypothetical protein